METTSQTRYNDFCKNLDHVPVFAQPWFIDAVTGGKWKALLSYDTKGEVQAAMAFIPSKKFGLFQTFRMPKLTPYLYPLFKQTTFRNHFQKSNYKLKHVEALFKDLSTLDYTNIFLTPGFEEASPLFKYGCNLRLRYTYILKSIKNHQEVWKGFGSNVRNHISNFPTDIRIDPTEDASQFYDLVENVFNRQSEKIPYTRNCFLALDAALKERNVRTILTAINRKGKVISAIYLINDLNVTYCIATGTDHEFRSLHPLSKLYWEGIKLVSGTSNAFNFCGSMIPSIERMFRSFNGTQTPYINVVKSSLILKTMKGL